MPINLATSDDDDRIDASPAADAELARPNAATPAANIASTKPAQVTASKATKAAPAKPASTKAEVVLKKLKSAKGASIPQLCEATSWQAHSVRGFLSGTIRKKLGLNLVSDKGKDGVRRYRIDGSTVIPAADAASDEVSA